MYYHATLSELVLGETITLRNPRSAEIDRIFDELCPSDCVPRSQALFAGDDLAFCAAYLASEQSRQNGKINFYRVELSNPSKHPMYLVSHARSFLNDKPILTKIIQEYWKPTLDWKCMEYTTSSIIPTKTEPMPGKIVIAGARFRYTKDVSFANRVWQKQPQP